ALVSGGQSFVVNNFYFWVPIVSPLLGGIVGALVYDFTVAKVLTARGEEESGSAIPTGEAVREPAGNDD
ncbi:MAG: hypothetical protein J2P36_25245, partial [Ktedonobacteraceae bacterium]|nr:hypothetical protein [Ktedonobacteraceae bacterium]